MNQNHLQDARDKPKAQRKEIYIGEPLRDLLIGRKHTLTSVVNAVAERYRVLIYGAFKRTTVRMDDVYRAVMRERPQPLSVGDIRRFPQLVQEWCERNPATNAEAHYPAAIQGVRGLEFHELLNLIDRLERM